MAKDYYTAKMEPEPITEKLPSNGGRPVEDLSKRAGKRDSFDLSKRAKGYPTGVVGSKSKFRAGK